MTARASAWAWRRLSSLSGLRVARELDNIVRQRGRPGTIVSDNGTELTSNAILTRADDAGVAWHYIAPGKPQQNGFIERFNGRATNCSTRPCSLAAARSRRAGDGFDSRLIW